MLATWTVYVEDIVGGVRRREEFTGTRHVKDKHLTPFTILCIAPLVEVNQAI